MTLVLLLTVAGILAVLAAVTAVWSAAIERAYPATGRMVTVTGGHLHVVDLSPDDDRQSGPPVVLLHGASGNLRDMRLALGDRLAKSHRVILIDRPGHGWSDRPGGLIADASPARQAALVREALDALGIGRALIVGYSWSGALATAFALDYPDRVAGLVLIAPVTHPWSGKPAWYNRIATTPVIGPLFARTIALPLGMILIDPTIRAAFAPRDVPDGYAETIGAYLLLRPAEFRANAFDVSLLSANIEAQSKRYGDIHVPTVIVTGDQDRTVSQHIHAEAIAAMVPGAELIVLPGIGHMVHHLAPDIIVAAIERVAAQVDDTQRAPVTAGVPAKASTP